MFTAAKSSTCTAWCTKPSSSSATKSFYFYFYIAIIQCSLQTTSFVDHNRNKLQSSVDADGNDHDTSMNQDGEEEFLALDDIEGLDLLDIWKGDWNTFSLSFKINKKSRAISTWWNKTIMIATTTTTMAVLTQDHCCLQLLLPSNHIWTVLVALNLCPLVEMSLANAMTLGYLHRSETEGVSADIFILLRWIRQRCTFQVPCYWMCLTFSVWTRTCSQLMKLHADKAAWHPQLSHLPSQMPQLCGQALNRFQMPKR